MYHTEKYDERLKELAHYQNYPQMLPFIGEDYDKQNKRLLIISESHYLSEDSTLDVSKWYEMNEKCLSVDEKQYTNTRNLLYEHRAKQQTIFKPIADAILEIGFKPVDINIFRYLAWYNFFQRPAEGTGESIRPTVLDREKAEETFTHIFDVINPTHVIFISSKAWGWAGILRDQFEDKPIVFDFTSHPNTSWWNREAKKYSNMTGKERFQDFLKKYDILLSL